MNPLLPPLSRVDAFCRRFLLRAPILLAPMAGACPVLLSAAVARAGGLGACGALLMRPAVILAWAADMRALDQTAFQINLWIPDPAPRRNQTAEAAMRAFLSQWGPEIAPNAGDATPPDFASQCAALIEAAPPVVSSIMGVYPPAVVTRLKQAGIAWWANATTVAEALEAQAAGADVIVAQGMEAGGHRGSFDPARAETTMVRLFSLLPAVVDAVQVPVVATGGIADARGIAAALLLGASAVQIGTGFLRCPEAAIARSWADAISRTAPEQTLVTRAFSGRAGRSIATAYASAAAEPTAPLSTPYPVQRGLTRAMRETAAKAGDIDRMQAWAGQSAMLARAVPAGDLVRDVWTDARALLGSTHAATEFT